MGILDVVLGRDAQGNSSKINMALIALLLWRWYQSSGQAGAAPAGQTPPAPSPRDARLPEREQPAQIPSSVPTPSSSGGQEDVGGAFGELVDSMKRMPQGAPQGRGRRRRDEEEDEEDYGQQGGGGPGGGGLGDILGEILKGGGRGPSGGGGRGPSGGGGLGDILGDILGGGRGMPGARLAGSPGGDPFSQLLGGLGGGGLGSLLAGGAAGGVLGDLMKQFEQSGKGDAARSWVSDGQNIPVTPGDIEKTFGSDIIKRLADQFGMDKSELLQGLSEVMPETIDKLTPDGRLPTQDEVARRA